MIIGNGAREHALAWKLKQSSQVSEVFCAPGNGGLAAIGDRVPIESSNIVELADFAEKLNIALTVVGPELPLGLGIVDTFQKRGLKVFGATQAAAEIETSKVFAKQLMRTHGVPSADFEVCTTAEEAVEVIRSDRFGFPIVLKADGLAAGKGVLIAEDEPAALSAVDRLMRERVFGNAGDRVVVEQFLVGPEVSFMVLTDGKNVVPLASAQDYKRAHDNDEGPNTGGMGSFSPSRLMNSETSRQLMQEIIVPTLAALKEDGRRFSGVLYAGVILTDEGPRVLEFNARFGDPEIQSIVTRMESDLFELLMAVADGQLVPQKLKWRKEVAVSVVLASGGYPGAIKKSLPIDGLADAAAEPGVVVFHAGTEQEDGKIVTCGGRVLTVSATAPSLAAARETAYRAAGRIQFEDMMLRSDIGQSVA